jgi:hypothetical protein
LLKLLHGFLVLVSHKDGHGVPQTSQVSPDLLDCDIGPIL